MIPLPSKPEAYSGKFNVRLPKSLHRRLAEAAAREDVSLNQLVVALLSEGLAGRTALGEPRALAASIEETRSRADRSASAHRQRRSVAA